MHGIKIHANFMKAYIISYNKTSFHQIKIGEHKYKKSFLEFTKLSKYLLLTKILVVALNIGPREQQDGLLWKVIHASLVARL
jgi:hypothetical protein